MWHFPAKQRRHTKGDTDEENKVYCDCRQQETLPMATYNSCLEWFHSTCQKFKRKFGPRTEAGNVQVVEMCNFIFCLIFDLIR